MRSKKIHGRAIKYFFHLINTQTGKLITGQKN
jgi:hypothetical protein